MLTAPSPTAIGTPAGLDALLAALPSARIAVFGDCCVDAYWWLDEAPAETSLETGLPVNRVRRQAYGLGGAGNVAANAAALGAAVELIGIVGDDCFGRVLREEAARLGIGCGALIDGGSEWQTMVYAKPLRGGAEGERFDFGAGNRVDSQLAARLESAIDEAAGRCGAVVLNQQVGGVLADPTLIERLNAVIARHPRTRFVVDARSGGDRFRGAVLKLNAEEAARLLPGSSPREAALALHRRLGRPVFLTRGERGLVVADGDGADAVPGVRAVGPVDPVGAGDTVAAAIAAALAVGATPPAAAHLANLAAAVTVRKLHATGTATPAEIRALAAGADHLHEPELAEDPRRARFAPGSEIEIVRDAAPARGAIAHAIFDHDGTISTLRQGWEAVMEPMMVDAVLGDRRHDASAELRHRVLDAVRELIDRTTGIQTLAQMQELGGLVRRFGLVPAERILDHHGYKRIYNDALMERIRGRAARLANGELDASDVTIKGAVALLRRLRASGVRLYLASGTDEADVAAEAAVLGYADLFDGGIRGAVGRLDVEAKRDVMDRILRDNHIDGSGLMVLGDGPVEIREGRRRGALCIGVASDEPRRYGLDPAKRARLIRAGADLIVPDFAQLDRLLPLLGIA